MFRTEDLTNVLSLERVLGGRRYGHFDHDASNMCGPFSQTGSERAPVLRVMATDSSRTGLVVYQDPVTGEYLPKF